MVNPIVLYVPPALPALPTGSTAVAPYRPSSNTDPFAVSDAIDIQVLSASGDPRSGGGRRWAAISSDAPGWWNDATPGQAANAYAPAARMSAGTPPNGQHPDVSV